MKPIIVVGTGTAAYLTVAYLHKYLPNHITWYRPGSEPIGVGEATTPGVLDFLKKIDIDERSVIRDLDGTIKLGICFEDFVRPGQTFTHPFGFDSEQCAINRDLMLSDSILTDFSNIQAVHFDIVKIVEVLDKRFETFDRLTVLEEFFDYKDQTDSIIVDTSGFARAVVKDLPDFEFVDFTNKIQNNQALVYRGKYTDLYKQKKPYTTMKATDSGYIWHIPLKDRISIGYVHSKNYPVQQEFVEYLTQYFGHTVDANDISTIQMTSGRNIKSAFEHNSNLIVAIGLSNSFIEPMESTGLYFTMNGIESLAEVIQGTRTIQQHNDKANFNYDSTVKFIIKHYVHTERTSDYWKFFANTPTEWYQMQTNGCWHQTNWKLVEDGLFDKQSEYKVTDIKNIIKLKLKKELFADFNVDPEKYTINSVLDRDI
jgi:tryptophan halogenase